MAASDRELFINFNYKDCFNYKDNFASKFSNITGSAVSTGFSYRAAVFIGMAPLNVISLQIAI